MARSSSAPFSLAAICAEVGEILRGIARRVGPVRQQLEKLFLVQPSRLEELQVVDQHPLLFDRRGEWRHRARGRAAHIGVMAARGHEKARRGPAAGAGVAAHPPRNTGVITVISGKCVPPR
jgi:hypothetical protein